VTSSLPTDFQIGVLVDVNSGAVFLGSACRFTCAGVRPASDCTSSVQASGPNFFGDRDAYVDMMFDDKILTWGSPDNRFVFPALAGGPGGASTFIIDRHFGGVADMVGLALDIDDNGLLDMLVVAKVPASSADPVEYRRIASNTVDTVTVTQPWDLAPAAGDVLVVGPLALMIHWGEVQTPRPVILRALHAIFDQAGVATMAGWTRRFPARLVLEQFTASGQQTRVNSLGAPMQKFFTGLEFERGTGAVHFSGLAAKAQSVRLTVLQGDDAPAVLAQLAIEERGA
jgi:hypothetical protein